MNGWVSALDQERDFLTWFEETFSILLNIPCDFENHSCCCLLVTYILPPVTSLVEKQHKKLNVISWVFSKLKSGRRNPICQELIA